MARRLQGHTAGHIPIPFLWVLMEIPHSGKAWFFPSQVYRKHQMSPGPPDFLMEKLSLLWGQSPKLMERDSRRNCSGLS